MKTFRLKTNISSERCVDQIASYLDNTTDIAYWYVDTQSVGHVLTVVGNEQLASRDIADIVNLAGFSARPAKNNLLNRIKDVLAA